MFRAKRSIDMLVSVSGKRGLHPDSALSEGQRHFRNANDRRPSEAVTRTVPIPTGQNPSRTATARRLSEAFTRTASVSERRRPFENRDCQEAKRPNTRALCASRSRLLCRSSGGGRCLQTKVLSRSPEGASVHGGAVCILKERRANSQEAHACPHPRTRSSISGGPSGFMKTDPQPGVVRHWKSKDRKVRSKRRCLEPKGSINRPVSVSGKRGIHPDNQLSEG